MALTYRQADALRRLNANEWRKENGSTLAALEAKGLAETRVKPRYTLGRLTAFGVRRRDDLTGRTL